MTSGLVLIGKTYEAAMKISCQIGDREVSKVCLYACTHSLYPFFIATFFLKPFLPHFIRTVGIKLNSPVISDVIGS